MSRDPHTGESLAAELVTSALASAAVGLALLAEGRRDEAAEWFASADFDVRAALFYARFESATDLRTVPHP